MAEITYQVIQKPLEERIIDAACVYYDVSRDYFQQKTNDTEIVYRKAIVYYLLKNHTILSLKAIAKKFGFIGHQPVMRLVENIEAQKGIYKQTLNDLNQVLHIADKLDAEFVTTSVQLVHKKIS